MAEFDCSDYAPQVKEIEAMVEDKYKDIFVTSAADLMAVKEELKKDLSSNVDDAAIDCYIYDKLSLGRLTPFLMEDNLEEIMVIGPDEPIYVLDRDGNNMASEVRLTEQETQTLIQRVAAFSSRTVDATTPLFDGRLPDGSRVNATYMKVSPKGSTMTIRKFGVEPLTVLHLLRFGTLTPKLAAFLWLAVDGLEEKTCKHHDHRRYGLWKDDNTQRPFKLHPGGQAHHKHRGHSRDQHPA